MITDYCGKHPLLWRAAFVLISVIGTGTYLILWGLLDNPATAPDNDYWAILGKIAPNGKFTLDMSRWLSRASEHITLIPNLIFAANVALFNGHNLPLQLLAFGYSISIALLLIFLFPKSVHNTSSAFVLGVLMVSLLVFTPHSAHSWFLGFSGIVWLGANLLFICSIFALRLACDKKNANWMITGTLCAAGSYLSYSIGIMAIVLCFIYLIWRRAPKSWLIVYMLVCATVLLLTIVTFERPENHPEWIFDIPVLLEFVGRYLGRFLFQGTSWTIIGGISGLAVYGILAFILVRSDPLGKSDIAPWILISAYPVGVAFVTGFSRAGFGMVVTTDSRYASLPALFWTGLLVILLAKSVTERNQDRKYAWFSAFFIAGLLIVQGSLETGMVEKHINRNHGKRLAEIGLTLGTWDSALVKPITPAPGQLVSQIKYLRQIPHVPFVRKPQCMEWLGQKLTIKNQVGSLGKIDSARRGGKSSKEFVELRGWTVDSGRRANCIAVIDATGKSIGVGVAGFLRRDIAKKQGIDEVRSGWRALIPGREKAKLQLAAKFSKDENWYRIGKCFRLKLQGDSKMTIDDC